MILQSKINCLKYIDKTHRRNCIFDVFYQKNPKAVDKTEASLSNENPPTTRLPPSEQPKYPYYTGQKKSCLGYNFRGGVAVQFLLSALPLLSVGNRRRCENKYSLPLR